MIQALRICAALDPCNPMPVQFVFDALREALGTGRVFDSFLKSVAPDIT
jgi:hypothetical protein